MSTASSFLASLHTTDSIVDQRTAVFLEILAYAGTRTSWHLLAPPWEAFCSFPNAPSESNKVVSASYASIQGADERFSWKKRMSRFPLFQFGTRRNELE